MPAQPTILPSGSRARIRRVQKSGCASLVLPRSVAGRLSGRRRYRVPRSSVTFFTSWLRSPALSLTLSPNVVLASQKDSTKKDATSSSDLASAASNSKASTCGDSAMPAARARAAARCVQCPAHCGGVHERRCTTATDSIVRQRTDAQAHQGTGPAGL
eukprot:7380525-Prymnesium_polylepis.1